MKSTIGRTALQVAYVLLIFSPMVDDQCLNYAMLFSV